MIWKKFCMGWWVTQDLVRFLTTIRRFKSEVVLGWGKTSDWDRWVGEDTGTGSGTSDDDGIDENTGLSFSPLWEYTFNGSLNLSISSCSLVLRNLAPVSFICPYTLEGWLNQEEVDCCSLHHSHILVLHFLMSKKEQLHENSHPL